ncbi:MAG: hypothetical protein RR731_02895 [Oscillospiraceae bacterium]
MKNKLAKFMYGRYGLDELSKALTYFSLFILILSLFFGSKLKNFILILAVLLIIFSYFRVFSKNFEKRRSENEKYLQQKNRLLTFLRLRRDMFKQRREYKFFKCPSCRAVMRVPRGKGNIRVVCKKCGTAFEKKT